MDCPRQYRFRYIDRLVAPGPRSPQLILGDLTHRALAKYHSERPENERQTLACVDRVFAEAEAELADIDCTEVRDDVAGLVLDYRRQVPNIIGPGCRFEVRLSAQAGPLSLVSRANAVWIDANNVTEADWKLTPPHPSLIALQTTFLHAGLRQRYPDATLRHLIIALRPQVVVREVTLDEDTYRQVLRDVVDIYRQIASERVWAPKPGNACRFCDYGLVCDAAANLIDSTPF
jgi:hypothetical protein